MLITISGPSGSGKSSAAEGLSKQLGYPTMDVGAIFRAQAKKLGMTPNEYGLYAEKHRSVDRSIEDEQVRLAQRHKDFILQGRLSGLLMTKKGIPAVRIWITATKRTRARRIAQREGKSVAQVLRETTAREAEYRRRYKKTYGLDVNDLSVYDIVVKTDDRNLTQVVGFLLKSLKRIWPKTSKTPPKKRLRK